MDCIIFLTHQFTKEFINTLHKIDNDINVNQYHIIVLFDNIENINIDIQLKNIDIISATKYKTSYDHLGHSMYINYFRTNYDAIDQYRYIWVIENDVYYPNSLIEFIRCHDPFEYDLLVSEYGTRSLDWYWKPTLGGFKTVKNIGIIAVIMRFSKTYMKKLIDTIDTVHVGYLEIILPHMCIEYGFTIQQFLPELCGVVTTDSSMRLLEVIKTDIINNTRHVLENKIYHPIKL